MKTLSFVLVACLSAMVLVACTDGSASNSSVTSDIADFWPPYVVSTTPASNAANVPLASSITVTFSEAVDPATVNASTFTVPGITGTVTYSGTTATFTPDAPLTLGAAYTATITSGVSDFANNALSANYSWSFTATPEIVQPTVISTTPTDAATFVSINTSISATFSEPMDWSTVTAADFTLNDGAAQVNGTLSYGSDTITFTPSVPLAANTPYTATITTVIKDMAGNALASNYTWSFTTDTLFLNPVSYTTGSSPEAVAIGDVNGDGRNDVVMTTSFYFDPANDYKVFVFLQNAGGGLDLPVKYATSSTYTCRAATVAIGDINNDGRNDVAIGNSGCSLEVFTQNVSGGLNAGVVYPSVDAAKIRIADLNNDGLLDVVGIGWGTSTASIWRQNAGGTLDVPVVYAVTHGGYDDLDVGDVNNDGLTDIVVMSGQLYAYPSLGILTQTAGGNFNAPAYYSVGANILTHGVAVGDINGDGLNDVVATYGGNKPSSSIGVFTQSVGGTLNAAVSYASYDLPEAIEIADVTGDGRKDIVVAHNGWMAVGTYQQLADGSLQTEELSPAPYGSFNPQNMVVGDVNSDGKPDAVIVDSAGLAMLYHY